MFKPFRRVALLLPAFLLATGTAQSQELLATYTGASGDAFGTARPAGDVNADGVPDLLVGAPKHATSLGPDVGSVRVVSGSTGATLFTFGGDASGDLFGWSCAAAGDCNGDGKGDVIVGAPGTGNKPGYARIFSGSNGSVLRTLTGGQPGGAFGWSVAGGRDFNGDGRSDVVVGAPLQDNGGTNTGSVRSFSGANGNQLQSRDGAAAGDLLGYSVSLPPGTQMTDNLPGVIIGCTQEGNGGPGYALQVSPANFTVVKSFPGGAAGDRFGASVDVTGDLNGDGTADIVVGSNPQGAPGYARALSGANGSQLLAIAGTVAGTGFGSFVAGVGDVDGDGRADLAVGEPLSDTEGTDAGSLRIYSGSNGAELHHVVGSSAGARLGSAVAFAGDLNGDLLADFATGAPGDASGAGKVYVLSLTRWEDLGSGIAGLNGIPRLEGQGGLLPSTGTALELTQARPLSSATLVAGTALKVMPSGQLSPTAEVLVQGLQTNGAGQVDFNFTWPTGMPAGFTVYYQFLVTDPAATGGQARSNTVAGIVP